MPQARESVLILRPCIPSAYTAAQVRRGLYNYPKLAESAYDAMSVGAWRELADGGRVSESARWESEPPPRRRERRWSHDGLTLIRLKMDLDMAMDLLPDTDREPLRRVADARWRRQLTVREIAPQIGWSRSQTWRFARAAEAMIVSVLMAG